MVNYINDLISRCESHIAEFDQLSWKTKQSKKYAKRRSRISRMRQIINDRRFPPAVSQPELTAHKDPQFAHIYTRAYWAKCRRDERLRFKATQAGYSPESYVLYKRGIVGVALELARNYHKNINNLATSSCAEAKWGCGGQSGEDRNYYSKSWHSKYGPKTWLNYGVFARIEGRDVVFSFYNTKNKKAGETKIPLAKLPQISENSECFLDGDLYALKTAKKGVYARYDLEGRKTGVAIRLPEYLRGVLGYTGHYEHGATIAQCKAEIARKRKIVATEAKLSQYRQIVDTVTHDDSSVRLFDDLVVTYDVARSIGLCDAGIRAFCIRHHFDVNQGASIGALMDSGNMQAKAACQKAVSLQIVDFLSSLEQRGEENQLQAAA